jgi:tetratricopeptide (TPR) repeat protein
VQRGNDLTLYIELVDANTENVLWKETYARSLTNFATMQSEIARDVSDKLRPKLSGADEQRVSRNYTVDSAAYQQYLKGRFYTLQYTPEAHKKAIQHLNEAIRLDPDFALAWAGLADAYTGASDWLLPPREALEKARAAAEKALILDNTLAEAHAALGHVLVHQFDPTAEHELHRALELNPNSVEGRLWYGEYFVGRDASKGVAILREAQDLDPLSPVIGQFIFAQYFFNRRYDEAFTEAQKTLQLDQNDPNSRAYLAFIYSAKGNHGEAIAILEDLRQQLPTSQTLGLLGMEYALTGRRNDALTIIAAINELSKQQYTSPYDVAVVYTGLGDKEQALAWLEKAREDRAEWMIWLRLDYSFDSLRSDPRLEEWCSPERQTL